MMKKNVKLPPFTQKLVEPSVFILCECSEKVNVFCKIIRYDRRKHGEFFQPVHFYNEDSNE